MQAAHYCIGVVAPSGFVEHARLEEGIARLQMGGHEVRVARNVGTRWRYFAGEDDARLRGFMQMVEDPIVDIVMAARGGYGWSRLLHRVDWAAMAASEKTFVGFSDFTAFNLALLSRNVSSIAGPMAAVDFAGAPDEAQAWMQAHFWPLIRGDEIRIEVANHEGELHAAQRIGGAVWGSNLTLLSHLLGTPYFPRTAGGILILEDIGVEPYAVERMLWQLMHTGVLQRQAAIVLGDFSRCTPTAHSRYPYAMDAVLETLRENLRIPVLTGFPFGHIRRKCSFPIGCRGVLQADEQGGYSLSFRYTPG
jgi:muramoyltetrapeptide carboxypeptidase